MKHATCITLAAFATCVTLFFVVTQRAQAQDQCNTKTLGQSYATAALSLAAPHVDNATWTSVIDISVPNSWPLANNLLKDTASGSFREAYYCLFPDSFFSLSPAGPFSRSISVSLDHGYVKMHVSSHGPIDDWYIFISSPWTIDINHGGYSFALSFNRGREQIAWTKITANTQGFHISDPRPLPAAETSGTSLVWQPTASKHADLVTFSIIPERMLRIALTAQTGGLGQEIPLGVEQVVFPLLFVAILGVRHRRKADPADGISTTTRRLCYTVASLSVIQVAVDTASQVGPYFAWTYSAQNIAQLFVIYAIGLTVLLPYLRKLGRLAAIGVTTLILLLFVGSLPTEVFFYGNPFSDSGFLPHSAAGAVVLRSIQFCSAFLSWTVILDGLASFRRALSDTAGRSRWLLPAAGALALVSILGTSSRLRPSGVFPSVFLSYLAGYIIAFCALVIVARRGRPVPLLPASRDKWLLALIVGYGMLLTGPQWYLGFHIGLVSVIGVFATLIVLTVSSRHSLIQLKGNRKDPQIQPAGDVLKGKTPSDLRSLQKELFAAEEQLNRVTKDLSVLQGTPLITAEQLGRREWLEKEEKRLRCWPTSESRDGTNLQPRLGSRVLNLLGLQKDDSREEAGIPFPEPASPADMALALGPECEPVGNLSRALRPALILVFVPVAYFAVRQNSVNSTSAENVLHYVPLIEYLAGELTFWLLPPLVLAVAWSLLAGRRGSERGLQAWLFVALPMAVHVFFNEIFDQSATLTSILRAAILLVIMLILGVWIDLHTLKDYRHNVTSFKLFQGYLRLNRVIAAVTLVLPLATAGLTIWNQINSGVLHQKVSPSQVSVSTPSPVPSAHPSPTGTGHLRHPNPTPSR